MAETEGALSKLLDVLISDQHRLSKRAGLVVLLIAGVWALDNYIGFVDYYSFGNKVDQVTKVETLLQRPNLDSSIRRQLVTLEHQILDRKNVIERLPSLTSLINSANEYKTVNKIEIQIGPAHKVTISRINPTWHFISSSWPILVAMIVMVVLVLLGGFDISAIGGLIIVEGILAFLAYGMSALFSFIPTGYYDPIYSYLLNIVLSTILVFSIVLLFNKNFGNIKNNDKKPPLKMEDMKFD